MHKAFVLLSLAAKASAHGAGVWKDPNHYVGEESLAGLRFIAEQPAHILQVVGTDDGVTWWHITGTCSGEGMTNINLDFSPKGGPSGVTGKWTYDPQWVIAREKIHFPDGNVWESTGYVPGAIELDDAVDDHVGVFVDPNHHVADTFKGLRFFAEFPPHQLKVVGIDDEDPTKAFFIEGSCSGPDMSDIYLDFRPKGGPELTGKWKGGARTITWPDGNVWSKPLGAGDTPAPAIKRTKDYTTMPSKEYPTVPFMAAVVAMSVAIYGVLRYRKIGPLGPRPMQPL